MLHNHLHLHVAVTGWKNGRRLGALQKNNTLSEVSKNWIEKYFFIRVGTLIVATIYLQLIQNRYMFRSFTVLQCSHQHGVQPVASDVEVVGYLKP